jgi:hypothetical protein
MESKGNIVDELDEIMENLDLKEASDYSDMELGGNSYNISNYSKEDFTTCYGVVSYSSGDEWTSGLELHDNEHTIFSLGASYSISNQHPVYVIIDETSEELNKNNNPVINPQNLGRGSKHRAEGDLLVVVLATQLGTPRGRYDEHSRKFPSV